MIVYPDIHHVPDTSVNVIPETLSASMVPAQPQDSKVCAHRPENPLQALLSEDMDLMDIDVDQIVRSVLPRATFNGTVTINFYFNK